MQRLQQSTWTKILSKCPPPLARIIVGYLMRCDTCRNYLGDTMEHFRITENIYPPGVQVHYDFCRFRCLLDHPYASDSPVARTHRRQQSEKLERELKRRKALGWTNSRQRPYRVRARAYHKGTNE